MLNLKTVTFRKFEPQLGFTTPVNKKKISHLFGEIDDSVTYTSFLLEVCETIKAKPKHGKTYPEILKNIRERVEAIGPQNISREKFADSIEFFEAYSRAIGIMLRYKSETNWEFPFMNFMRNTSHMTVLEFVLRFDKTEYPLIADWEEFVVALPNFLARQGERKGLVKFASYFHFVKSSDLAKWYRATKGYATKTVDYTNFREMYCEEVRGYDDERLGEECRLGGWGREILEQEFARRKRQEKMAVMA